MYAVTTVTLRTVIPLLLLAGVSTPEPLHNCPEKCLCDVANGIYDCRSAGLSEFPWNLPSPSSVKELLLSGNKFTSVDQLNLMHYKNMRKLDMASCGLAEIDDTTFENNRNLTELRFGDNNIITIKLKTFQGLSQLKYLDFTGNALSEVPGNIFQDLRSLRKLDLSRNLIQDVDKNAFLGLISLDQLDLSVNQIGSIPIDSLSTLPSLSSLRLSGNAITVVPFHAFRSLRNLQKLKLDDNQIQSVSDLAFHGKDSTELPKLKYLSLRTNRLQTVPILALQNLSALSTLDLSDNPISSLQTDSFSGLTHLRQLYLNEMSQLVTIAPYSFSAMKNLREIQLHRNVKLKHLPSMTFGGLHKLKQFDLCCSGLTTLSEDLIENWDRIEVFDIRLNPWHCDCELAWLGQYLKNHSSSRLMSNVQCESPLSLRRTPVMNVNDENCLSGAQATARPRNAHLSTVLWVMIALVLVALVVVGLFVLYRYKGRYVKKLRDQMRYRHHNDQTDESLSSRLSLA